MSKYFKNIRDSFRTMSGGLKLTLSYLSHSYKSRKPIGVADKDYFKADKGTFTLQYPHESFPVPDNGRYRLHNEIDDCIVCDKCAKVCPVDCIEIDAIKAPEVYGYTSDGTAKRIHAAKFDIDMGKCCFCGLCTTVCPTECLTMTKVYDFSEFDIRDHKYSFSEMSLVEIAQKKQEAEEADRAKAEKLKSKTVAEKPASQEGTTDVTDDKPKPKFRPRVAAKPKPTESSEGSAESKPKPKFRPKPMMKKPATENDGEQAEAKPKPKFKPRPMIKKKDESDAAASEKPEASSGEEKTESGDKPRPKFKPRPMVKKKPEQEAKTESTEEPVAKPKPVMKPRPVMKKKDDQASASEEQKEEEVKPKPKFRPRPVIKKKPKDKGDAG